MKLFSVGLLACVLCLHAERRPIKADDIHRFQDVGGPQCSPDGKWVAYTLSNVNVAEDKRDTDVWMVSYDGKQQVRITSSPEAESAPKWSPDGRYLSFLSGRPGKAKGTQVWLLDRNGGEAQQWSDVKARISDYQWSPDSKKILLTMRENEEPEPEAGAKPKPPKAWPEHPDPLTPMDGASLRKSLLPEVTRVSPRIVTSTLRI